jgi:hypothetical protein
MDHQNNLKSRDTVQLKGATKNCCPVDLLARGIFETLLTIPIGNGNSFGASHI